MCPLLGVFAGTTCRSNLITSNSSSSTNTNRNIEHLHYHKHQHQHQRQHLHQACHKQYQSNAFTARTQQPQERTADRAEPQHAEQLQAEQLSQQRTLTIITSLRNVLSQLRAVAFYFVARSRRMGGWCSRRRQTEEEATEEEATEQPEEASEEELPPIPSVRPYRPSTVSLTDEDLIAVTEDASFSADGREAARSELRRRNAPFIGA